MMLKQSLIIISRECFEKEGNCLILYLENNVEILLLREPVFRENHLIGVIETPLDNEILIEQVHIPYNSIVYVTVTSLQNINKFKEFQSNQQVVNYEGLDLGDYDGFF